MNVPDLTGDVKWAYSPKNVFENGFTHMIAEFYVQLLGYLVLAACAYPCVVVA